MKETKLERALAARLSIIERKLLWLLCELRDREDVIDGDEGPSPNDFMHILAEYERKFGIENGMR